MNIYWSLRSIFYLILLDLSIVLSVLLYNVSDNWSDNRSHLGFGFGRTGRIVLTVYIGHSDLHITYYGLPHVWYTPGKQVA